MQVDRTSKEKEASLRARPRKGRGLAARLSPAFLPSPPGGELDRTAPFSHEKRGLLRWLGKESLFLRPFFSPSAATAVSARKEKGGRLGGKEVGRRNPDATFFAAGRAGLLS